MRLHLGKSLFGRSKARRAVACPDMALIELHGLDAYACCSFLALCARLAAFCCALGCCVLLPIYYWAARPLEAVSYTHLTLPTKA